MSPTTAALIAVDLGASAQQRMEGTPESWASSLDELGMARRYGQTLRYLQNSYLQVLSVLPSELGQRNAEVCEKLQTELDALCVSQLEQINELLGEPENVLLSVPKFYYSALQNRLECPLPTPPELFAEADFLSFLSIEAVGCYRTVERFELLAGQRAVGVPAETWRGLAQQNRVAARKIVVAMVLIFGEPRTSRALNVCIREEHHVCTEMLDGSTGNLRFGKALDGDEEDEDEEDDGIGETCGVDRKPIYIVSDCTGESAERTVSSALGQFGHCFERSCESEITTFRFCTPSMLENIVKCAQSQGALIVYTLVDPVANRKVVKLCEEYSVPHHDLWSTLLEKLEGYFDTSRMGIPGRRQFADAKYMKLIDCIEYTRMLDDGVQPERWSEADIMIIGPSRSGKTPLSFFMAQRGYKVANYPLVPDESPPPELWDFRSDRVFALDIHPSKLASIRNVRMKSLKMGTNTSYAKISKIREEMDWVKQLYRRNSRWTVIDTTDAGIEEISSRILMALEQGVTSRIGNADNPSAI